VILMKKPIVIAHRGASGHVIENSILSFETARNMNADMVELDVQETCDGFLVVFHDFDVSRLSEQDGLISEMTLKEIQAIDLGGSQTIPLLNDVLDFARGKIGIDIELKSLETEERIISMLHERDMLSDVMFSSYMHATLMVVKEINSELFTGILYNTFDGDPVVYTKEMGLDAINPKFDTLTSEIVDRAHEEGLQIFPFTVNESDTMLELIKMGVDGIITDFPDMCVKVIQTYTNE